MKNSNELIKKFSKYSASQLVAKIQKTTDESEKNAIISILRKRGRDVEPYIDKTAEEIFSESIEDEKMEKDSKKSIPKSKESLKEKKEKSSGKKNEIYYEDKNFPAGAKIKILNDSIKVSAGTEGKIKKTGFYEGSEEAKFAYIKLENGKSCSRMLKFIDLA